ncbi:RNA polymerase sigma factor [Actinospongicola halichondriae]|uniref:RNA polymerase sigma factor n=1 Tax=Actinospongicola halichondriae TaxID=3236844 RepID=UPI003D5199A9
MAVEVGALYRDHAPQVWRYARTRLPTDADAEDVTSEVFTRAMGSLHRFDPAKGTEAAWVLGIARNVTADFWRRRKPEDPTETPPETGPQVWSDVAADAAVRHDDARSLLAHLTVLSDREREAVALRFGAELSSPEIGEAMDISPTAARMLVHRGVTKLREVIDRG